MDYAMELVRRADAHGDEVCTLLVAVSGAYSAYINTRSGLVRPCAEWKSASMPSDTLEATIPTPVDSTAPPTITKSEDSRSNPRSVPRRTVVSRSSRQATHEANVRTRRSPRPPSSAARSVTSSNSTPCGTRRVPHVDRRELPFDAVVAVPALIRPAARTHPVARATRVRARR
jgi:hypothetical protein